MIPSMRGFLGAASGIVLILVAACSAVPGDSDTRAGSPLSIASGASTGSTGPLGSGPVAATEAASPPSAEPDDPAVALAGRAVEALGAGGIDLVMRIGVPGFRLPDPEALLDIHGDRVLSGRIDDVDGKARLIVRDLDGVSLYEIDTGMQIPQEAVVRGNDVYFGGVDTHEDATGLVGTDRGAWIARGDAAAEPLLAPTRGPVLR